MVHSKKVGKGQQALKYLAPYVYRIAISNNPLVKMEDGKVTFRYKASDTNQWRLMTLEAMEFILRFLQHVLPKDFMKIRSYGFLSPTKREDFKKVREILGREKTEISKQESYACTDEIRCPKCGGKLLLVLKIAVLKEGLHEQTGLVYLNPLQGSKRNYHSPHRTRIASRGYVT